MKISLGAAERDFLRYSAILIRMLPLRVSILQSPSPLLSGTSVLPLLNVPVTLPLKLSLRKCRSRAVFLGSGLLQVVFLPYFLYGTGHTGARPVQRFTDVR